MCRLVLAGNKTLREGHDMKTDLGALADKIAEALDGYESIAGIHGVAVVLGTLIGNCIKSPSSLEEVIAMTVERVKLAAGKAAELRDKTPETPADKKENDENISAAEFNASLLEFMNNPSRDFANFILEEARNADLPPVEAFSACIQVIAIVCLHSRSGLQGALQCADAASQILTTLIKRGGAIYEGKGMLQ